VPYGGVNFPKKKSKEVETLLAQMTFRRDEALSGYLTEAIMKIGSDLWSCRCGCLLTYRKHMYKE
jgi:hypothetical protein